MSQTQQQQTTNNKQQTTNNKQQTTNNTTQHYTTHLHGVACNPADRNCSTNLKRISPTIVLD